MPANNKHNFTFTCPTIADTQSLAAVIGGVVEGGDVLEFTSDLGGGKTTFVKGLGKGMGVQDVVQSPTFTLSQLHKADRGLELHHFDFYRLDEPGVMSAELAESLQQPNVVTAIEWGDIVHDILPKDRTTIHISVAEHDETRIIRITSPTEHIAKALYNYQHNGKIA